VRLTAVFDVEARNGGWRYDRRTHPANRRRWRAHEPVMRLTWTDSATSFLLPLNLPFYFRNINSFCHTDFIVAFNIMLTASVFDSDGVCRSQQQQSSGLNRLQSMDPDKLTFHFRLIHLPLYCSALCSLPAIVDSSPSLLSSSCRAQ
jgi:hypothetical protein